MRIRVTQIAVLLLAVVASCIYAAEPTKIDNLILSDGVVSSPEVSRRTLIRRLSFDLLGLPPTSREVEQFANDRDPQAYDRLVNRLLASPHFGERMAQFWLDLARYADSDGYHDDTNRSMWLYRDYVIDSFNKNKPFDHFTIEQLAGDLLPNATLEQQVATAFHRNAPTSSEDGANPDEYRVRYAVDRVNTTSQVWLGLTIQCAECHDHKYDPITTKEYYQLLAFFNQSLEEPLYRGLHAPPSIEVPNEEQASRLVEYQRERDSLARQREKLVGGIDGLLSEWTDTNDGKSVPFARSDVICELLFQGDDEGRLANTGARRRAAKLHPGEGTAVPTPIDGLIDGAFRFHGRGDAVDLGQLVEFRTSLPFTFEAWVKYSGPGGPLISKTDPLDKARGVDVRVVKGRVTVRLIDQWPDAAIEVATIAAYPPDRWMHVSVTWDGVPTAAGIHVYFNGEPQDLSLNVDGVIAKIRNRKTLLIGGSHSSDKSFEGNIDEVRFYKWPLPSQQLSQLPMRKLGAKQSGWLREHFIDYVNPATVELRKRSEQLRFEQDILSAEIPRLRIMRDGTERRTTFVLKRGDFRAPGEEVSPGIPSMLAAPRGQCRDRLDFAKWLVNETQIIRLACL